MFEFYERRAKRGFGSRKSELLKELRELNWEITHYIILDKKDEVEVCRSRIEAVETELESILIKS